MNTLNSLLKGINNYIPLREFLNYIFKTVLSDFLIVNNLNIENIENDISSNSFLNLTNLELNTSNINANFLTNSPIKLIFGKIGKLTISILENNKVLISIEKLIIRLMPLFNNRYYSNLSNIKNTKANLPKDAKNNEKKNEEKEKKGNMINNIINGLLNNIEINITNICCHIMSYETISNDINLDNPVFSFYILNFKCCNNKNVKNNFFLNGMNCSINYICMKVDKNLNSTDEKNFMKLNPNKIDDNFYEEIYNFFLNENTIFGINYKINPSILMTFTKKENDDDLKIIINIERLEFILTPIQLFYIRIFSQIIGSIFRAKKNKNKVMKEEEKKEEESPIKILDEEIKNFIIGLNTEKINFILFENINLKRSKLFSFYHKHYGIENLQNFNEFQNHFCYYEDNFIFLHIKKINYSSNLKLKINDIYLKYINYKGKNVQTNKNNGNIGNSSIYQSVSNEFDNSSSIFMSVHENNTDHFLEEYKDFINKKGQFDLIIYDIIFINKVEINVITNEINIFDFKIEFHFIILFILIKLSFQNDKFPQNYNNVEMDSSSVFINNLSKKKSSQEIKNNEGKDEKTISKININNFTMKIYNFTEDKKREDLNEYYYIYHLKNIIPFYSEGFKKNFPELIDLNKIISKDYMTIQLNGINIEMSSPEFEVNMKYKEFKIFYCSYQLLSYIVESNEQNLISYSVNDADNQISIMFPDKAFIHIEYNIIFTLLEFSKSFMFSFSMIQIVNNYINDIYVNKLLNLFYMYGINFYSNKGIEENPKSMNLIVKGNINNLIILLNKKNTFNENEGNILKIDFFNIDLLFAMKTNDPNNQVIIKIDDINIYIKQNNPKNKYYLLLGKLPVTNLLKIPFINIEILFQMNEKETKINSIEEEEEDELKNKINDPYKLYQNFLLSHQVPMKDIFLNISFNISNTFLYSIYNDFKNINMTLKDLFSDLYENDNNIEEQILLIPINEDRKIDLEIKFSFTKLYHDIFYEDEEVTNDKWMRMVIVIDSISGNTKEIENSIEMNNFFIYFLKDFNYKEQNNYNITQNIQYIQYENSYLKRIGLTEFLFTDNISINKIKDKYIFNIKNTQIYMCKDTFDYIQEFFNEINEKYFNHLKNIFPNEPLLNKEEIKKIEENNEEEIIKENDEKKENLGDDNFGFQIIESYLSESVSAKDNNEIKQKQKNIIKETSKNALFTIQEEYCEKLEDDEDYEFIGREQSIYRIRKMSKKNEENINKMKITFNMESLRIYLYKGKDFLFESEEKTISSLNEKILNERIEIEQDYLINNEDLKYDYKILPKRKRKKCRKYDSYLEINFQDFNLLIEPTKINFSLMNFEIKDHIENSKYSKLFSKYEFKNTSDNIFTINININEKILQNKAQKIYDIILKISPINILIDQLSLLFILKFFEIKLKFLNEEEIQQNNEELFNSKIQQSENKENDLFLKKVSIEKFYLYFSYNSHELSLNKLIKRDYKELLNITNITDFKLTFKKYYLDEIRPFELGVLTIIDFYKNDVLLHQIAGAVLHSVAFLRPFITIYDGFTDIFKQPIVSLKNDEGVRKGIKRGFFSFFSSFTSQSLFIGEKLFRGVKKILIGNTSMRLGKDSLYRQWLYRVNEAKRGYDIHFKK